MKIRLSQLRTLIREVLQENERPDNASHTELVKAITNGISTTHSSNEEESVIGGDRLNLDEIESDLRDNQYFQVGSADYNWELIREQVLEMLQKDYQEKIKAASNLIEKLQHKPSLGEFQNNDSTQRI